MSCSTPSGEGRFSRGSASPSRIFKDRFSSFNALFSASKASCFRSKVWKSILHAPAVLHGKFQIRSLLRESINMSYSTLIKATEVDVQVGVSFALQDNAPDLYWCDIRLFGLGIDGYKHD